MATRRQFLRECSVLAASVALAPDMLSAIPAPMRPASLASASFEQMAAQVNSTFRVCAGAPTAQALTLVAAERTAGAAISRPAQDPGNETVSLLFHGDPDRPLSQDTYAFEHADFGRFDMFIVPVGPDRPGPRCYEAVFNRPAPQRGSVAQASSDSGN